MKTNEEYRLLEQQNLELLAAIEVKNEELKLVAEYVKTEMIADLAKRDQKRDAALLRTLAETFNKRENWGIDPKHYLIRLSSERESGEWKPELEIKP